MKIHPREEITNKAKLEFMKLIGAWMEKYDLTLIEMLQILTGEIQTYLKYALRQERHPKDPDKPAGLA